ncbi:flagellar basal body P-ring formation chaperone FlgA [Glaciecola siphonariae]|uniref:Flagella basal body P-ring formation protein FlgA n=1 Tax=Glaciecola siphonariae TaxID=521012 RepID=A0ABV9LVG7_9ALTE
MQYMLHIPVSTRLSIVFTLFFVSLTALAQTSNHMMIQVQAEEYVLHNLLDASDADIKVNVREIDERIQIPYCPEGYQFASPNYDSRLTNISVKVTCPSNQWFLFTHVSIQNLQQVVVTSDTLSPGAMLSSRNMKIADIDKGKIRGSTFSSMSDLAGARIKRRVRPGTILNESMLCFVCKGDRVTISAITGGLSIQVYGIAEEDGTLGETIQVRNTSSDKLVFATVSGTEEVQIKI